MLTRLDKFLTSQGVCTRSEAGKLCRRGRVTVEGTPVTDPAQKVDPDNTSIAVDGRLLTYKAHLYIMMNKPAGILCVSRDPKAPTVLDLLPPELKKQDLFPVGRLDKDTEGLLLLTNEGGLAHELLSPRHHVDKVYYTRVAGRLTEEDCRAFASGMTLDDGLACMPAGLEILSAGDESEAYVTLREGKFHQVKRMLAYRGKPVLYLERISMGNMTLDPELPRGKFRFLTSKEVENLRKV